MFDKLHFHQSRHQTVTVHEHRAPTDESVRLLRDAESRAAEAVLCRVPLKGNELHGEWVVREDHLSAQLTAICRFKLNGRDERVSVEVDRHELHQPHLVAQKIHVEVAKAIAAVLTVQLFESNTNLLRR